MTEDREQDPGVAAGRLELQARLLEVLRHDLESARQANESKDRQSLETWRRLRLYEMLLEESQRDRAELREELRAERTRLGEEVARLGEEKARLEAGWEQDRARLNRELLHLRSTLSWRITSPLRRVPRLGQAGGPAAAPPAGESPATPKPSRQLDLMEQALWHLRAKGFRPGAVLDVGAAKGHWSTRAAALWPEAAFYLFDPLTESEPALRALAHGDARFHPFLMALGRERATRRINVASDPEASSLLEFPGHDQAAQREVPVETVDGLLAAGRIPRPDLVKLDVQGYELEVLAGATALFRAPCVFVVEVSLFEFMPRCPLAHEVVDYFAERGYRLFDVAGLLRRPFQDDLGQMDLVFVPRDSPLAAERRWS
jgi:FkbM family methyltransferase